MLYHFIGIKGSGMASLATILADRGEQVQGSDIEKFIFTQQALEDRNIPILSFNANNIKEHMTRIIQKCKKHEQHLPLPVIAIMNFSVN